MLRRLRHDGVHPHARVQRRIRVLEDHLDLAPVPVGHAARPRRHVLPPIAHIAAIHRVEPRDHPRDGRLARPALADETEDLALPDLELRRIDGGEILPPRGQDRGPRDEALGDPVGLDQGLTAFGGVHGPAAREVLDGELRHSPAIADQRETVQLALRPRHGGDQRFCIRMLRPAQHLRRRPAFHHRALVHDGDDIRGIRDHAHVVGDQDHAHLPLPHRAP
jgi:hypothetical protein